MNRIVATCVLLAGFLFAGCVSIEEQIAEGLLPVVEQLPDVARVIHEAQCDGGGDVTISIYVHVEVHKLF